MLMQTCENGSSGAGSDGSAPCSCKITGQQLSRGTLSCLFVNTRSNMYILGADGGITY